MNIKNRDRNAVHLAPVISINKKMMKINYGICIFFLFFSGETLFAQRVSGTITKKGSNKKLERVVVKVKNRSDEYVTTASGFYRIEATKGDTLTFSKFGYDTKEIIVKKDKQNIVLRFNFDCRSEGTDKLISALNKRMNEARSMIDLSHPPLIPCPPCPCEEKNEVE